MVDTKAVVMLEGAGTIIPPGEFANLAIELPKEVRKTPLFYERDRRAFRL